MFCAHCGNQLKAHNKFCAICGSPVKLQVEKETGGEDTKVEKNGCEKLEKDFSGRIHMDNKKATNLYILSGLLVMVAILLIIIIQYKGKLQSLQTEYLDLQSKNKQLENENMQLKSENNQLESEKAFLESEKEEIISQVNRSFDGLFEQYPNVLERTDKEQRAYKEAVIKEIVFFLKTECSIDEVRNEIVSAGGATITVQTGYPVTSTVERLNDDINKVLPPKIGVSWLKRYNWKHEINIFVDEEGIITIDSGYEETVL